MKDEDSWDDEAPVVKAPCHQAAHHPPHFWPTSNSTPRPYSRHCDGAARDLQGLNLAVADVVEAFRKVGHRYSTSDMVALQLGQLAEVVQHDDRQEYEKAANEWADQISIAWQALAVLHGVQDVERFVVDRIREKVIPSVEKSMEKYRLARR